ncbi:MAG: 30S ribosomal protein S9 [Candidatus Diapherotrites archaeon]|nr:30S ribosomal protein S9 [Candidatus Diapherotrites archaeon]
MAKRRRKIVLVKAKKKTAVARAVAKPGKGRIVINKKPIETIECKYLVEFLREPLTIAGEVADEVDISVNVQGGGRISQLAASRSAIAKALVEFTKSDKLKKEFIEFDRSLLVDDPRRVEPKKPLGKKARRKWQHSKR